MTINYCIPPEFIGISSVTLQAWLTDCQNALQMLTTGRQTQALSYAQRDGSKAVTYTVSDIAKLEQRIRALAMALGLTGRRRAIRVAF